MRYNRQEKNSLDSLFKEVGVFMGGPESHFFQKNPCVREIFVRNSGVGNGCANFMGAWKNAFFLQEKPMSIKFLPLGGGCILGFGGEGRCRFYFYGREDFSDFWSRFRATLNFSQGSGVLAGSQDLSSALPSSSLATSWRFPRLLQTPQRSLNLTGLGLLFASRPWSWGEKKF